jgi:hypothetical protein
LVPNFCSVGLVDFDGTAAVVSEEEEKDDEEDDEGRLEPFKAGLGFEAALAVAVF